MAESNSWQQIEAVTFVEVACAGTKAQMSALVQLPFILDVERHQQ